jgi:hypothetical protein
VGDWENFPESGGFDLQPGFDIGNFEGGFGTDISPVDFSGAPDAAMYGGGLDYTSAADIGDVTGGFGLPDGLDFGTAFNLVGPALSIGGAALSENPGQSLLKEGVKTGLKEGIKYLGNETGVTDYLTGLGSDVYDWAAGGLSDLLGLGTSAGAGVASGLGEAGGAIGAELAGAGFEGGLAGASAGLGAAESGLIPAISAGASGLAMPLMGVAPLALVASFMLSDELADPGGRVSAAQNENYLNQQGMPDWIKSLQGVQKNFGNINSSLSDSDIPDLFQSFRSALKNNQLMADPMAHQGNDEFGVQMTNYGGGVANLRNMAGPEAALGTIRLQDLAAQRGITLDPFETATPLQLQMMTNNSQAWNNPGANGEYTNQHMGQTPFNMYSGDLLNPLGPLSPGEALNSLGFGQANLAARENAPQMMELYGVTADNPNPEALQRAYAFMGEHGGNGGVLYSPDVMEQLYNLKPGEYESGLMRILGLA